MIRDRIEGTVREVRDETDPRIPTTVDQDVEVMGDGADLVVLETGVREGDPSLLDRVLGRRPIDTELTEILVDTRGAEISERDLIDIEAVLLDDDGDRETWLAVEDSGDVVDRSSWARIPADSERPIGARLDLPEPAPETSMDLTPWMTRRQQLDLAAGNLRRGVVRGVERLRRRAGL